jgi:predicted hotdog family 3-hydroxylacyl-ACP dehydratase
MKIDRIGIERLVPHAGAMCLLDGVNEWSEQEITCTSALPAPGHALARDGRVPGIAAIEYAAQATAVHGALLEQADGPRAGMLATLVDVRLHLPQIPGAGEPLSIRAGLLSRSAGGCLYSFEVGSGGAAVASGRLLVALRPVEAA